MQVCYVKCFQYLWSQSENRCMRQEEIQVRPKGIQIDFRDKQFKRALRSIFSLYTTRRGIGSIFGWCMWFQRDGDKFYPLPLGGK